MPGWLQTAFQWLPDYIINGTVPKTNESLPHINFPGQEDPSQTEDCLFLDVFVPKPIFDRAGSGPGAPVLVWIHGKNSIAT
jgi:carboxylesterase type B